MFLSPFEKFVNESKNQKTKSTKPPIYKVYRMIKGFKMKKKVLLLIIFWGLLSFYGLKQCFSLGYTYGINNPNGQSLKEKTFAFSFLNYNNGGVQNKFLISIFEPLDLGISFDIQRAIGDRKPRFNAPGVIAKIKFTSGTESFPIFVAVGYDSFFTDEASGTKTATTSQAVNDSGEPNTHLEKLIYGPYLAITKPIYLLNFEQYLNFGIRVPVQPEYQKDDTALFVNYDIPLGEQFVLQMEVDRIYINRKNRGDKILYNFGMQYFITKEFRISFFIMTRVRQATNRILAIHYQTAF